MNSKIFVDTSGFYALLVKKDECHEKAQKVLREATKAKTLFVTTDYILDETATLLRARSGGHLAGKFFKIVFSSKVCRVEWTDQERFFRTEKFYLKHHDHPWSFTDCLSFCVMGELKLSEAFTNDLHFRDAGYKVLLR